VALPTQWPRPVVLGAAYQVRQLPDIATVAGRVHELIHPATVGADVYDRVADLDLRIAGVRFRQQETDTIGGFTRRSTTVLLDGDDGAASADGAPAADGNASVDGNAVDDGTESGHTGRGEDVTYDVVDQERFAELLPTLPLAGSYTLRSFSRHLDGLDLFPTPPERAASRHYRRWALESAALDLALRQADLSLGEAVGRDAEPIRFVVSPNLSGPDDGTADGSPDVTPVLDLLDVHPSMGVKVDAAPDWDEDFVADLAATGAVEVVDLKAHYEDAAVATEPDPSLYRRVRDGFPEAILEDPGFTPATEEILAGAEDRLSWDAPITSVDDVADLPVTPRWLNCKPSRFGTVESLLSFLAYCEEEGISLYGGGQFELDVGRRQIQHLAALWYPGGPNDVAPPAYNDPEAAGEPPGSPLSPPGAAAGFGPTG